MRRALAAVAAAGLLVIAFSATASAVPPERVVFENVQTFSVDGICPFPVEITINQAWSGIDRYDASGNPLGFEFTVKGFDTFSAVHTLVSEPYTYHLAGLAAGGEMVKLNGVGVTEKFRLPDGRLFVAAGWISYLDKPIDFVGINPDHGSMGDMDALCDALS